MLRAILLKTSVRYFCGALEFTMAFVFGFLIIAFYGEAIPTGEKQTAGTYYFYVRSNGIHTDLCLPVQNKVHDWTKLVPTSQFGAEVPKKFVSMGWGDKGFYMNTPTWKDLTVGTAFNAIAVPTPTAMHVTYCEEPKPSDECIKVYCSQENYAHLVQFVQKSFLLTRGHATLIKGKGYTVADNFYEAERNYHLMRTCNTWTNQALKSAHVRTGYFAVFPYGVMKHLR